MIAPLKLALRALAPCKLAPITLFVLCPEFEAAPLRLAQLRSAESRVTVLISVIVKFDLDRTVQVNKYELVELGTPLPPLTVHTDEASWQDMCILLAKEQGWCPNPVFDGDGVPIGKLIQAKKNAVESFNFHSAFDSPFEQWGLPRRKSIPRLPEDADILAIE